MIKIEQSELTSVPLTKGGQLKPTVTKLIKEHMVNELVELGFILNANNHLVMEVGVAEDGRPVYFKLEPVVTSIFEKKHEPSIIEPIDVELTGFLAKK